MISFKIGCSTELTLKYGSSTSPVMSQGYSLILRRLEHSAADYVKRKEECFA